MKPNTKTAIIHRPQSFVYASRLSVLCPLVFVLILPMVVAFILPGILDLFDLTGEIFILLSPFWLLVVMKVIMQKEWVEKDDSIFRVFWKNIKLSPHGIVWGTDLSGGKTPIISITIVFLNTVLFFVLPENFIRNWTFLPYGNPSLLHIAVTIFTSAFLHGDIWHLFGNMAFFITFGVPVEQRIGSGRFAMLYFLCIITSKILVISLLSCDSAVDNFDNFHSLGASGAISGIIGVFAVRCFFSKVTVSLFWPFLPISLPVPIPSMLLIGLYLAYDMNGAAKQYLGQATSNVNYWSHVGGYLGGFIIGFLLRLDRDASKEYVDLRAQRLG